MGLNKEEENLTDVIERLTKLEEVIAVSVEPKVYKREIKNNTTIAQDGANSQIEHQEKDRQYWGRKERHFQENITKTLTIGFIKKREI